LKIIVSKGEHFKKESIILYL